MSRNERNPSFVKAGSWRGLRSARHLEREARLDWRRRVGERPRIATLGVMSSGLSTMLAFAPSGR
jgi:hypothetical protein